MKNKVILISIDGMRPDGMQHCGNPYVKTLEKICAYTYTAESMNPTVTLPCHFSMAHSVAPQRHGILTNTYIPQVRPVKGIFEKVRYAKGFPAIFQAWDPIRDIALPGMFKYSLHIHVDSEESTDTYLTDAAIDFISKKKPDLVFLYLVETDEKGGHSKGWMSEEYLRRISVALDNAKRVIELFGNEYSVIVMSDHGGHDRLHGTIEPEDMTIPLFFYGKDFAPGMINKKLSLLDIAPTIAKIMEIEAEPEWEGEPIF